MGNTLVPNLQDIGQSNPMTPGDPQVVTMLAKHRALAAWLRHFFLSGLKRFYIEDQRSRRSMTNDVAATVRRRCSGQGFVRKLGGTDHRLDVALKQPARIATGMTGVTKGLVGNQPIRTCYSADQVLICGYVGGIPGVSAKAIGLPQSARQAPNSRL